MNDITIDNILQVSYEDLHRYIFALVEVHVDYLSIDSDKFAYLLGYYSAIYNYLSELYAFMINQVRVQMELNDKFTVARYRDKRDMLEQALKSVKFQYDSLSRKITLLAPNLNRGDEL
jgi:hypothetical protein